MANVSAIKSGNWSDPTVWSTGLLPTASDDVYSNSFNVTIDQNVTVLSIRQSSVASGTTGGTFILTNGIVVRATSGGFISRNNSYTGVFISFTLTAPDSATLIGNFSHSQGDAVYIVQHSGTGTLNIIGNLYAFVTSAASNVRIASTGTLNITGNLYSWTALSSGRCLLIAGNSIVNITGDIIWQSTITGGASIISITSVCTLNIVGSVNGGANYGIESTAASYIKVIGSIIGGIAVGGTTGYPAISSNNTSAINIFTGPFICSSSSIQPLYVSRMNYFRTSGSYFEFRDNSTNGALPPAASAPATRLVAPSTAVDAPSTNNVRFGITYASGSQTGTMYVPTASNVRLGVGVDNTVGTAALSVNDIWNVLTSTLNTSGSIGERLKNTSTVDSTGTQIASITI